MKKKQLFISSVILLFFTLLLGSCNDDDTTTIKDTGKDKEVKEDKLPINIVDKVEVIYHYGHLHGRSFHANAQPEGSPYLRKQVLTLKREKNTWKQIKGNDKNELKQGASFVAEGGGVYAFEFVYYNKEGKRINSTFAKESKMYQTFFSIDSYKDTETNKVEKTSKAGKSIFSYTYRDTDPEDKMYKRGGVAKLSKSNLGLKGYLSLKRKKMSFSLNINLVKFKDGYKKETSPFYLGIKEDMIKEKISFKLPVNIVTLVADMDDEMDVYFEDLAKYFNMPMEKFRELESVEVDYESAEYWM